ncbi:MAG: TonB-dependent receptor [Chitinophagaceae bacterium]|nr:MAG: TonB-dependent receptor [Chitinophagaceae bacterium]
MKKFITSLSLFAVYALNAQEDSVKASQLDPVVITGQFQAQSMKQSVYKIRTITQERIRLRAATDIAGVLNNEPGIRFSTDYALGETDISIMGMSGQNVKILLDGVPVVDRGSIRQSLGQIDINTVERIEIVEGPMSVIYGTDALAGVINIITKKAKAGSHFNIGARVQEETVGKEYEAFTGKGIHNESLNVGWGYKKWNASGSVTRNNMGGWQGSQAGRTKEWRPKDQWLTSASVGYRTNKTNIWYRLNYLNELITIPGAVNPGNNATDQEYITDRFNHQLQANFVVSDKLRLTNSVSYQDYERRTRTTDIDLNTGSKTLNINLAGGQDLSTFKTFFLRSTAEYTVSDLITLQPGIEIKNDQSAGQRLKGNPSITDYALFVSGEIKPLSWLNIRPGIRFSKNSIYDAPPLIPSLNTKLALGKQWDLRLSYARGFRAPALRELYFDFHDANHDINGNENLKAEYSNSFNASLNWEKSFDKNTNFKSAVAGLYNSFDNLITTALANDPSSPNLNVYVNIDKYKTTGASWENSLAWKDLFASVGFLYVGRYNRYSDDPSYKSQDLPGFMWSPELNLNLTYTIGKTGTNMGLFYKYTGKTPVYQLAVINGQQDLSLAETADFHFADFTVAQKAGKYLIVNAGVKNIFNVTRLQNTATDSGGAHSTTGPILKAAGRSYFIGLAFQFAR